MKYHDYIPVFSLHYITLFRKPKILEINLMIYLLSSKKNVIKFSLNCDVRGFDIELYKKIQQLLQNS